MLMAGSESDLGHKAGLWVVAAWFCVATAEGTGTDAGRPTLVSRSATKKLYAHLDLSGGRAKATQHKKRTDGIRLQHLA